MRNSVVARKLSTSYKKLEGDYGAYPAGQGAYPGAQGAYPAGQGNYQAGAPPPGWNPAGATPQGWNQGGAPPQAWNPGAAPPAYSTVAPHELPIDDDFHGDPPPGSIPSAPPPQMDSVAGYEGVGYTAGDFLAPPTRGTEPSAPPNEARPKVLTGPTWSDEEARSALLEYVAQNCCFGTGTAKDMVITNKKRTDAYHYILETFGESRQVNWTFKPYYMGDAIDGPENGRAPAPWEMHASVNEFFKDVIQKIEIPHTSYVRPCHTCSASGRVTCYKCYGRGMLRCKWCHGRGNRSHMHNEVRRCTWCHGHGQVRCRTCVGCGCVTCPSCLANCNIRLFLELTVQWKNHVEDYISQSSSLPQNLIKNVEGTKAFQETNLKVWPISHFVVPEINRVSHDLVTKHDRIFPTERILQQKHTVRCVPIMEVEYSWKDTRSNFFVYGLGKTIHAPDYPQTCCCGCTIL